MLRLGVAALAALALALASCTRGDNGPTPVCSYAVTPASHAVEPSGGTRTVTVTTSPTCSWTPASSAAWVTVAGAQARTGSGSFDYVVAANPSTDARSASMLIGGLVHTVTQQGQPPSPPECTYAIAPASATIAASGGPGTIQVTAPAGCAWTATTGAPWLEIEAGQTGNGSGTVGYRAEAHTNLNAREGTITLADRTFVLRQEGLDVSACTYSVGPVAFAPCMPAGSVTAHVATADGCPWTATSRDGWIGVDGDASRTGPGEVRLGFNANYLAPREGVVEVRWPTPTAGQNVRVSQAGCVYATTVNTVAVGAGGGSFSFGVLQQAIPNSCGGPLQDACVWTATAGAAWVTLATSMPRQGDQNVAFTVAANPGSAGRSTMIVVQDRIVTIEQAGQP